MLIIGVVFWHIPDRYRFSSALAKPVILRSSRPLPQHPNIVIIGDCAAQQFPISAFKISFPKSDLDFITIQIQAASPIKLTAIRRAEHILILGTEKGREEEPPAQLIRLLGNKSISFVPASEIVEISKEHGDGRWHLDKLGYDTLSFRHPDLLPPILN